MSRKHTLFSLLSLLVIVSILVGCAGPTPAPAPTAAPAKAAEPTKAPAATAAPAATKAPEATKAAEPTKAAAPAATAAPAAAKAPAASAKIADGLTISYWVDLGGNAGATQKSFNEMSMYKELEKRTGIKVDFQHPPLNPQQGQEQFNLMMTSRKFPDVIEANWLAYTGGPAKAIKDKSILRLNELIDQHAPNFKKLMADHPEWRKMIVNDEGDIYCLPFIRGDNSLMVFQGPIVRKDWLDKLGIPMPETIDDWYAMLQAFRDKDPNGNSKKDEVPFTTMLYGLPLDSFKNGPSAFIGAWDTTWGFYQDGGKAKYGPLDPQFKDFLTVMAKWYKEGLIDPDTPTMDQKLEDAKVTGNILGSFVQNTGGGIGKFMGLMAGKDDKFKLVAAPYPVLKKGEKPMWGQRDQPYPGSACAAITTAAKNVPEIVKWLDYAYGPEGHMLFNFGVEGLSYNMVDGFPKYTDLVMKNPNGLPLAQSMAQHFRSNFAGPFIQDARYFTQYANLPEQQDSIKVWGQPSNEKMLPPITPTQDESKKFASVMNDINTFMNESMLKIVTGQQPVSSWDDVVKQLKAMGIEDAVKVQQAALDRYNARK